MYKTFHLKAGVRLGCTGSATQIEGGETDSSWNEWFHKGMIQDNANPAFACEHYERYEEDFALMAELGIRDYRMGIEWSRIQPEEGTFDEEAMAHYRAMIQKLLTLEIRPLLTLHHCSNPMWFERKGGFGAASSISDFLKFVEYVVRHVGDLVEEYVTLDEPNTLAVNGYYFAAWPPGKKDLPAVCRAFENLAVCHIRAYEAIHAIRSEMGLPDTRVGFAVEMRVFEPNLNWNPIDLVGANRLEKYFQTALTDAMALGKFSLPVRNVYRVKEGRYFDFLGVNYYTRRVVKGFAACTGDKAAAVDDLGNEIYPRGIVRVCELCKERYSPKQIYITANGVCDNQDVFRIKFIYEHLYELCGSELPVTRYYYRSLTDGFEWLAGESARFDLIEVDFTSQARTVKRSGRFYAEIIENAGVNADMIDRYLTEKKEVAAAAAAQEVSQPETDAQA